MRHALLAGLPLLLAGCAIDGAHPPPAPDDDACRAASYQGLVGQPAAVLDQMQFPIGTRVIGPDAPVTADYRAGRLNIEVGPSDRIDKVSCY